VADGLGELVSAASAPPDDANWMLRAKCRGMNPATFFPTDGAGFEAARKICLECPVRAECLEYALVNRIDQGAWGGTSERERRRILRRRLLLAAATMLPIATFATPAGAATKTTCKTASGSAAFTPALPKVGSTSKVKSTIKIVGAKLSGCKGGGVTGAKLSATVKFAKAANCDSLLAGRPTGAKGTETITWSNKKTSTVSITLASVTGKPTQTKVTGVVTAGQFKGAKQSGTLNYTPLNGGCTSANLAKVNFAQVSQLTFS
jgi:WhiB family redox-sensing transcriptional regulator